MTEPVLLQEQLEHVRVLRLNRPERKNALNDVLGWAIVEAVEAASRDDDVRAIAITGVGDAFCSGLDLRDDGGQAEPSLSAQERALDDFGWVNRFPLGMRLQCDKPVVAGINGIAVGAGFSLAMAADVRLASDRARVLAGYIRAGTSPDGGLTWTLPQAIGYEGALRFLLEQELVGADRALSLGIVGEVVPAEDFDQRLLEYARALSQLAPLAVRQTKRMVGHATTPAHLETHLREEIRNARRGLATEDGREAIQALREKRAAVFQGR